MKVGSTIARFLLGLLFTVFGLNGFFHFIPTGPVPSGHAGEFFAVLYATHYMVPVFVIQLVSGVLFFANRYVPLALTLIAPVIVNILLFHALMNPGGIAPGLVAAVCWSIVFASVRSAFDGILKPTPQESVTRQSPIGQTATGKS